MALAALVLSIVVLYFQIYTFIVIILLPCVCVLKGSKSWRMVCTWTFVAYEWEKKRTWQPKTSGTTQNRRQTSSIYLLFVMPGSSWHYFTTFAQLAISSLQYWMCWNRLFIASHQKDWTLWFLLPCVCVCVFLSSFPSPYLYPQFIFSLHIAIGGEDDQGDS